MADQTTQTGMSTTVPPAMQGQNAIGRIFTATLVIGVPGSGKTSLFTGAAEYCWETYRKVLLLYSWDGGAIPTLVQKRMKQGLIRFWRCRTRSADGLGVETTHLATKGYWPREINPLTGETSPAVELVAPLTLRYRTTCRAGHTLQTVPVLRLQRPTLCKDCGGKLIPLTEQRVEETLERTVGFEQVGMVGFDGLTSMCSVVAEHMDIARGQGQIGGEKSAFGGVVRSGGVAFGGSNRADIGFAQTRAQQWVNNSLSIPYLVEGPIFTALAMEVSDEGGLPVVGPQLAGRAATDVAPAWFGNVTETGKTKDDQGKEHFTLFLRPFTDPQGRRHLLKTSASPVGVPDKLVDPLDQPFTEVNLGKVFRLLDADLVARLAEDTEVGPGMAPSSYGESQQAVPAAAVASAAVVPQMAALPTTPAGGTTPAAATASAPPVARPVARPVSRASTVTTPAAPALTSAVAAPSTPPAAGGTPPPPGMRPPAKVPSA